MAPSITLTLASSSHANSLLLPLDLSESKDHHHNNYFNDQNDEWRRSESRNHYKSSSSTASSVPYLFGFIRSESIYFSILIIIWYSVSVGHNLLNKRLLEPDLFPYPFTLTLMQLASITGYSYIYLKHITRDPKKHSLVTVKDVLCIKRNRSLIIFLSFGKFLTLVFSHLSLSQVPLAFTHTGLYFKLMCVMTICH